MFIKPVAGAKITRSCDLCGLVETFEWGKVLPEIREIKLTLNDSCLFRMINSCDKCKSKIEVRITSFMNDAIKAKDGMKNREI